MMRALVVDDSRAMRSLLRRILVPLGVEVTEACDGLAAIDIVEAGPLPDLALVDWHMPVMDGLDLVKALRSRKQWRQMAIMMVTTESEHENMVRALLAGANEYLIKPFTADAVMEKLALLGLHLEPVHAGDSDGGVYAP
jgi:two-component system chemotaxis response regulator CheY